MNKENNPKTKLATFAGGCFWCMQPPYDDLEGVLKTVVGYTGGETPNPSYEQVCAGTTGHTEAVQIEYDPQKVDYEDLLEVFWRNIDPTSLNRQFADIGTQYRSGIFYHDEGQRKAAELSKNRLEESGKFTEPIVTEITPASKFYPAEGYHQKYYITQPQHYKAYSIGSGRKGFIQKNWGG